MQRLYYASGSVLTGERICAAVLSYAAALQSSHRSAVVTIPSADAIGAVVQATLLLGPSSTLLAVPDADHVDRFAGDAAVEDLEERTRELEPARPTSYSAPMIGDMLDLDLEV